MRLLEHYARLYDRWKERGSGSDAFMEVTIPGLAVWFYCSERNAKLLIQAMQRKGWIAWQPGQGRGRKSRLCCVAVPDQLILEHAKKLLDSGHVQEAVELLEDPFLTDQGRVQLRHMMQQSFRYLPQGTGEQQAHRASLRFPSYRQPGSLDPAYATRRTELHWIRQLYDTLVLYDIDRQGYQPGLAHHWESDRSARTWRFYLQKHVQFHNGAAFTADDVRFTLERLASAALREAASPRSPYDRLFSGLRKIEPLHDHLIEIEWEQDCHQLLGLLTLPCASIVPVTLGGNGYLKPVGTGPFMLTRREERLLVLKANPSYYLRPTQLDQVEMWCLPEIYEQSTGVQWEEQEGEGMNFWHYWAGQQSDVPWEWLERMDRGCKYVLMNQAKQGPLQQISLREQIHEVIRQGNAMHDLGGNRGELAYSFVRGMDKNVERGQIGEGLALKSGSKRNNKSGMYGEFSELGEPPDKLREPDRKQEPVASMHSSSAPIQRLELVTYAGAGHERDADWLQQELRKIGIELHIRRVPYDMLGHPDTLAAADLWLLEQPVDADDEAAMWAILGSDQSPLRSCLSPDRRNELERRLGQLQLEKSRSARLQGLSRLERELLGERAVVLWYRWRQMASFPPELQGVSISSLGWVDYKALWFRE